MNKYRICLKTVLSLGVSVVLSCGNPDCDPGISSNTTADTVILSVSDTLGLLSGDSTLVFGTITQASWGEEGRLYVLDGQFGRLSIYSGELKFIRCIGRLGSGPGEFQYPQSFAFLGDGRLAVCDWGAGSVVFFDSTFIAKFGQEKEPEHIYISWPLMISAFGDPEDPDLSIGRVDQDFDSNEEGTVYLAERDDSTYLVEVFLANGTVDTLVNRLWERVEKSQEQMEQEFYEETREEGDGGGQMGRRTIQDIYPWLNAIGSIDVDPNGDIWVGQAYTDMPTFEVYSPSGELRYVAVIPDLAGIQGLEFCFRNGYLAYDRQPVDYPKVYLLERDTITLQNK